MKVRSVITYGSYFKEFFSAQPIKVRDKIIKILDIIEQLERIPSNYLKYEFNLAQISSGYFVSLMALNLLYF